jgi:hypothetical protein
MVSVEQDSVEQGGAGLRGESLLWVLRDALVLHDGVRDGALELHDVWVRHDALVLHDGAPSAVALLVVVSSGWSPLPKTPQPAKWPIQTGGTKPFLHDSFLYQRIRDKNTHYFFLFGLLFASAIAIASACFLSVTMGPFLLPLCSS